MYRSLALADGFFKFYLPFAADQGKPFFFASSCTWNYERSWTLNERTIARSHVYGDSITFNEIEYILFAGIWVQILYSKELEPVTHMLFCMPDLFPMTSASSTSKCAVTPLGISILPLPGSTIDVEGLRKKKGCAGLAFLSYSCKHDQTPQSNLPRQYAPNSFCL